MEKPSRIRLVFEDCEILSKSKRSAGLDHSWLFLNSSITTISDLASHVCKTFELKRCCPNGLLLSMDDFVLPPFESTCVLKDKDIIRVRKKDGTQMDVIEFDSDTHYIQDSGIIEKDHTVSTNKLPAIRECGEDSGQHWEKNAEDLFVHHENANHKGTSLKLKNKRKLSDEIEGSKKKKSRATSEKPNVTSYKDEVTTEEVINLKNSLRSSKKRNSSPKSSNNEDKPSTCDGRRGALDASLLADNFVVIGSPKRDKRRKNSQLTSCENARDVPIEQNQGSSQKRDSSAKCLRKRERQSDKDGKSDAVSSLQPDDCVSKRPTSVIMEERCVIGEENIGGNACESHGNDTKVQSRSSRRKNARRKWARKMKSQEAQNAQSQTPLNVYHTEISEQQKTEQDAEMEKELVPIVIRPGHIRFQPLDEEQSQWQSQTQETLEILQWNGTTSKKKGQKWGREKAGSNWHDANGYEEQYNRKENGSKSSDANGYTERYSRNEKTASKRNEQINVQKCHTMSKRNNSRCYIEESNGNENITSNSNDPICHNEQVNGKEKGMSKQNDVISCEKPCNTNNANKLNNANGIDDQSNREATSEKGKMGSDTIDFESLSPLTRIPQVGDVLAYRLIELSASWCPEVSPFRVGQVASYDCLSTSIILVPVPEFPLFLDEDIEGKDSILEENSSLYNEDGSLQIHYPSLVDVRLFKASNSEATTSLREMTPQQAAPEKNCEPAVIDSNAKEALGQPTGNENMDASGWDEIKKALNEKKEELLKKGGQEESTPSKSGTGNAWSYKALRRSAVGPTLAYLRENNDKACL